MIGRLAAVVIAATLLPACGLGGGGPPWFFRGSARLPDCTEPPATVLTGEWFDQGQVTITSQGCEDAAPGEVFPSCPLNWVMTQAGGEVDILVDNEYEVRGRLCGDQLHLEGGWWLPVEAEGFGCTYEDEDAAEVGIEAEGSVLTAEEDLLRGTLVVRERCTAEYDVTLTRL
ncbi:MAG: hypothetical protein ACFCGT_20670 [Sandaracinaceae bacterium]